MTVSHGSIAEPLEAVYPERLIQPPSGLQSHWSALHCEYHRETKAGEQMKMCDPAIWGIGPSCQPNKAVQCSTCTRNVHTSGSSLMFKKNANYLHLIFIFNFQLVNSSLSPFGAKDIQCNRLAGIRASMSLKIRLTHITEGNDIYRFIRVYPKKGILRYSYKTLLLLFLQIVRYQHQRIRRVLC